MTKEYDVYLDGVGYMLATGADGRVLSGAAREQRVDPFTRYVSTEGRWAREAFRFGEGAGLAEQDGSHRYMSGKLIDTRGGRVIGGPARTLTQTRLSTDRVYDTTLTFDNAQISTAPAGNEGIGQRWQVPAGKTTIRRAAILVRRAANTDYGTAANFTVEIRNDAAGTPGALVAGGSVAMSLQVQEDGWLPFPDGWRANQYFWLEVEWNPALTVVPGNQYWFCVVNNQAFDLFLATGSDAGSYLISLYNGAVWGAGASGNDFYYWKLYYSDQVDAWPRAFCQFRGVDSEERVFAGVGSKVMYWNGTAWVNCQIIAGANVLQLLEFNDRMFVAVEDGTNAQYYDGTTATTVWTGMGVDAQCFAIHDGILWRADAANVNGSLTGLAAAWGALAVTVGDPGTPVQSLISHGGKLYAGKPEGVFEISYPAGYPGAGTPTCNLMLDFRTERSTRNWLVDHHSGFYFPGYAGVYELRSGLLRNVWTEKVDEGALEAVGPGAIYTRPRRWGLHYDAEAGGWASGWSNTRGMLVAHVGVHVWQGGPYQTGASELWWYDGGWHPLGPGNPLAIAYDSTFPARFEAGEYILAAMVEDRGGGRGRLWYGYGDNIGSMEWPTWTEDRAADVWAEYEQDGYMEVILPEFARESGRDLLDFYGVGVYADNMDVNDLTVYYAIDDGAWTLLGTITVDNYDELYFPANTTGRRIVLGLRGECVGRLAPLTIRQVDLLYQPLPETVVQWQLTLRAADVVERRNAAADGRTATEIVAALEALLEEEEPWTFQDWHGRTFCVRALGVTEQVARQLERSGSLGYRLESHVIVTLLKVAASCPE